MVLRYFGIINWRLKNDMSKIQRVSPESLGISSSVLVGFYQELKKNKMPLHNFILMRHGKIATLASWAPYTQDIKHIMYSTSKTITALAVGFCIDEGYFELDDRVVDFFPEKIVGPLHAFNKMRTIRHLLTMTGGESGATQSIDRSYPDWLKSYLNTPPRLKPGTLFGYDNLTTHTLGALVQKVTGMKLFDYLRIKLFEPLGIESAFWQEQMGINTASRGFHASIIDIAKIGQFILQKGQWEGEQLISREWIEQATKKQVEVTNFGNIDGNLGYGYQFWMYRDGAFGSYGVGGQHFIVIPKYDVVWAFTGNLFDEHGNGSAQFLHFAWPFLLNSISETSLSENPTAYHALLDIENSLSFPFPSTIDLSVLKKQELIDHVYSISKNSAQINSLSIKQSENGVEYIFNYGVEQKQWIIDASYNSWHPQSISITNDDGWARCGWRTERILECVVLLKEQLGSYYLVVNFESNNEIALEIYSLGWIRDYRKIECYAMGYHI